MQSIDFSLLAGLTRPTLLLDEQQARKNISRMAEKAARSGVRFRPHFKTHQSARVGEWFREAGVDAITVSSLSMAAYFARHGWRDITVAFPVNPREANLLRELAAKIRLGVLVEAPEVVGFLEETINEPLEVWIKIDCGYHRTGILWEAEEEIVSLARQIAASETLRLAGILTHAGQSYHAESREALEAIYRESVARMREVQKILQLRGLGKVKISVGDTPTCSVVEHFDGVDEVRPGNFIFYDLMQWQLGSCRLGDIALALACPVVARHPEREEVVIYGGAVHLSKEFFLDAQGRQIYGLATVPEAGQAVLPRGEMPVVALSQEHGVVRVPAEDLRRLKIGGLLLVFPVHSCLTADLMGEYLTLTGERIPTMSGPKYRDFVSEKKKTRKRK